MAFLDGNFSSINQITGTYREFNFKTDDLMTGVSFKYDDVDGYSEDIQYGMNDFEISVSNKMITTYANLPFKAQDTILDSDGNSYVIESVSYDRNGKIFTNRFSDKTRVINKTIFLK